MDRTPGALPDRPLPSPDSLLTFAASVAAARLRRRSISTYDWGLNTGFTELELHLGTILMIPYTVLHKGFMDSDPGFVTGRMESKVVEWLQVHGGIMFRHLKALTISPALASGVTSQHHQLQQRAPVSGTAKGKAKLKAGQPLKRSTIGAKKGAPSTGGGGGGRGRREAIERITNISESCLNASTPLRHLFPKERLREAKREELGLVSKERQRELDVAKAKAKAKSKGTGGGEGDRVLMGPPGLDYISLGLVDEEAIPKYELTVEDGRRLAKEYSRVLMRRHRARQTAESTLLTLKKEAIAALPEKLRAAAMVPDMTPFPANRYMATLTPPIEGYIEKVREAAKKHSVKEKLR
ncbi:unnamed protein product [Miscanthus lutarioriparius]|uniref:Uncharacterized protein n=1 Tax=Miscanthus lutarioriparius TaxID=422564 RepID=A0A811PS54_9POAL|nr:unnamed protein product [Miscanthus lutarioriparius]